MKTLGIVTTAIILCLSLAGCDRWYDSPHTHQPDDLLEELEMLIVKVVQPSMERVRHLNAAQVDELRLLIHRASTLETIDFSGSRAAEMDDLNHQFRTALGAVLTSSDFEIIHDITRRILVKRPELNQASFNEVAAALSSDLHMLSAYSKAADCGGLCAAQAGVKMVAIEAGFIAGAVGCAALTVGAGICMGALLVAKHALIADLAITLIQCNDACEVPL